MFPIVDNKMFRIRREIVEKCFDLNANILTDGEVLIHGSIEFRSLTSHYFVDLRQREVLHRRRK